jgi:hypothetical protein
MYVCVFVGGGVGGWAGGVALVSGQLQHGLGFFCAAATSAAGGAGRAAAVSATMLCTHTHTHTHTPDRVTVHALSHALA